MINNSCHIEGYLGQDPEMRYLPNGTAITSINVGVSEYQGKDKDNKTQWFVVKFFGTRADFVNEYLKKGNLVTVNGRMSQYQYEDKEGNKKYGFSIVGEDVKSYKTASNGNGESKPAPAKKATAKADEFEDNDGDFFDDSAF